MKKITDYIEATTMADEDFLEKSEYNSPIPASFESKKITWANFILAIKALLTYVVGDGGSSIVDNIAIFSSTDAAHIVDSGIPIDGLVKISIPVAGSGSVDMPTNSMITTISVKTISGTPTIKIGTTLGGNEILDTTPVGDQIPIPNVFEYFSGTKLKLYYELAGSSPAVKLRIDYINKYY